MTTSQVRPKSNVGIVLGSGCWALSRSREPFRRIDRRSRWTDTRQAAFLPAIDLPGLIRHGASVMEGGRGDNEPPSPFHGLLSTPRADVVRWILGSAGLLMLGSFGPWVTATAFGGRASASGLEGGGWSTLFIAVVAVVLVLDPEWLERAPWVRSRRLGVMLALASLGLVICGLNVIHVGSGIVRPGWGLYLALAASASLSFWSHVFRVQESRGRPDPGSDASDRPR